MLYEQRHEPLLPPPRFLARLASHVALAGAVLLVSLGAGVIGYHVFADLPWVDALECATMILTGMGPTADMPTDGAKIFASVYALYSGVVFISSVGVMAAPVVHRVLHHFHVER